MLQLSCVLYFRVFALLKPHNVTFILRVKSCFQFKKSRACTLI